MVEATRLLEAGLLEKVYGKLPSGDVKLALPIWALKGPKQVFVAFVRLAEALSQSPLTVLVDDVCAQCVVNRSDAEQLEINKLYTDFFLPLGCKVEFSSTFLNRMCSDGAAMMVSEIAGRFSFNSFLHMLPVDKRASLHGLGMIEVMHAISELAVLDYASNNCNTLVVGKFSQAVVVLHRNTAPKPLPALITPKFKSWEHTEWYIGQIEALK